MIQTPLGRIEITKDEKKDYIIDFIENDNGTYTVLFADGKKFIVSSTDKNFEILAKQQEAQAQEAVANNSKFVLKRNIGRALTPLSGIAAGVGGYALSTLPVVQNAVGEPSPAPCQPAAGYHHLQRQS